MTDPGALPRRSKLVVRAGRLRVAIMPGRCRFGIAHTRDLSHIKAGLGLAVVTVLWCRPGVSHWRVEVKPR